MTLTLISRKGILRGGSEESGLDDWGLIGGDTETEQVITYEGVSMSFVSQRCHVPAFYDKLADNQPPEL